MGVQIRYLSQTDVIRAGALDMEKCLEVVEETFRLHATGQTILPIKIALTWGTGVATEETDGRIMTMPAYVGGDSPVAGLKWIPSFPQNPTKFQLPRASALIVLSDMETGLPVAVMDGIVVSHMRTGAATGVAVKYLANRMNPRVSLVGTGPQALAQLEGVWASTSGNRELKVYDIERSRIEHFIGNLNREKWPDVTIAQTAQEVVEWATILTTPTTAPEPYIKAEWIPKGSFYAHVSNHDAYFNLFSDVDKLVVDDWEQVYHHKSTALARAVDSGAISSSRIRAELGDIIIGRSAGREKPDERIVFYPIGLGVNDIAWAHHVYKLAIEQGIGTMLPLWDTPWAV